MIIIDNFPSKSPPHLTSPPSLPPLSLTRLAGDQAEDESCPVWRWSYKSITCQSNINLTRLQHKYGHTTPHRQQPGKKPTTLINTVRTWSPSRKHWNWKQPNTKTLLCCWSFTHTPARKRLALIITRSFIQYLVSRFLFLLWIKLVKC